MNRAGLEALPDVPGFEIADDARSRRYRVHTDRPVDPSPAPTSAFRFPVSDAVEVTAASFTFPTILTMYVREDDSTMIEAVEHDHEAAYPADEYCVEIHAPVKTFLRVDAPLRIESDHERMRLSFGGPTEVRVGFRAYGRGPPGTIRTTGNVEDVFAAVSHLSTSLLSTSPERSYPTMRRCPPTIELGDDLAIPDGLEPADTDVEFELPPTLSAAYAAASPAYYLGATLTPTDGEPRIVADGFTHPLDPGDLAGSLRRVLQQAFVLDCVVRVHGLYPLDLRAYDRLAPRLPFDPADAYGADPATRLATYLSDVEYRTVEPHVPRWPSTAHVEPVPESVTAVPHLARELSVVRPGDPERHTGEAARSVALESFVGGTTRSAASVFAGERSFVDVPGSDALAQLWVGGDVPLSAHEPLPAGYRNGFERPPTGDADIRVTIVCNDPAMREEVELAGGAYGRPDAPREFDLTVHEGLETAELAAVVERDADFLHYVGHATAEGFDCPDGTLGVDALDDVGATLFLLNACRSYDAGRRLVEAGAVGGVATLSDVGDEGAVDVGRLLARLLNRGHSLRTATAIAREKHVAGGQYLVLGNGNTPVTQPESAVPYLVDVERDGGLSATLETFTVQNWGLGSYFAPQLGPAGRRYLAGSDVGPFEVSPDELADFLDLEAVPVRAGGEVVWSTEFDPHDFADG